MEVLYNKYRNIFFIVGFMILIVLSYQYAFKHTIQAYEQHQFLKRSIFNNIENNINPEVLKNKIINLNNVLSKYSVDSVYFKETSIGNVAAIAESENLRLKEIPASDPNFYNDTFIIQRMDFEGDYFSMIKFIQKLQFEKKVGVLKSISIFKQKENFYKPATLQLEIYLQILK